MNTDERRMKPQVDPLILVHVRQFLELECRGHEAAKTKEVIAGEIALLLAKRDEPRRSTVRMVMRAVHDLREHGAPVGSSARGYFWRVTRRDAEITAAHIRPRFASMKVSYENAMDWAGKLPEQLGAPVPAATASLWTG